MNVFLACFRSGAVAEHYRRLVPLLNQRLCPDNIAPREPRVAENDGLLTAVLDPNPTLSSEGQSVCVGHFFGSADAWAQIGSPAPDGTYALFRAGENQVELLTDVVASRTIWYAHTPEAFLASTSQRAIVTLLGDLHFNEEAVSWMLGNGILGPGHAWDERICHLPGDARLTLDRRTWRAEVSVTPTVFEPLEQPVKVWRDQLETTIRRVCEGLHIDPSKWALTLSGGKDSRALLAALPPRLRPQSFTYGLSGAVDEVGSDAHVAAALASHYGLDHTYFSTDLDEEVSAERILNRFLIAGEGRVEYISAYADGFAMWKAVREKDIHGILRGDEGFGRVPVASERMARHSGRIWKLEEHPDFPSTEALGLPKQHLPNRFRRREGESLLAWRDRLFHCYQHPFVLAGLTNLKTSYVELASPLLSRDVMELVRRMPDSLRANRALYRSVVSRMGPSTPMAERRATASSTEVVKSPSFTTLFQDELRSAPARSCLSGPVIERALDGLPSPAAVSPHRNTDGAASWFSQAKGQVKRAVREHLSAANEARLAAAIAAVRGNKPLGASPFAFRAVLVSRMRRLLEEDTQVLSSLRARGSR